MLSSTRYVATGGCEATAVFCKAMMRQPSPTFSITDVMTPSPGGNC